MTFCDFDQILFLCGQLAGYPLFRLPGIIHWQVSAFIPVAREKCFDNELDRKGGEFFDIKSNFSDSITFSGVLILRLIRRKTPVFLILVPNEFSTEIPITTVPGFCISRSFRRVG